MIFHMREKVLNYNAVSKPSLVAAEFAELGNADQESLWVLGVDVKNRVMLKECLFVGGVSESVVDLKILFKRLIVSGCSGFVVVHNHPSGEVEPGDDDRGETGRILSASKILDIRFLDHVIVGGAGYYSFQERGMMKVMKSK